MLTWKKRWSEESDGSIALDDSKDGQVSDEGTSWGSYVHLCLIQARFQSNVCTSQEIENPSQLAEAIKKYQSGELNWHDDA